MRVLPILKLLMSEWEDRLEDDKYKPVHNTLKAGIKLLEKYYRLVLKSPVKSGF